MSITFHREIDYGEDKLKAYSNMFYHHFMKYEELGRIVSKFIPSGVSVPILKGPLRGAKWIVGAASGSGKGLSVVVNLSEPEGLDMAVRLTPRDGICFDIGANVGFYTLLFSRYSKYIFAFEPLPRNVSYLWRTLKVNSVTTPLLVHVPYQKLRN